MNIGGELRRARMTRKLSLADISRRTKIAPAVLRAIESNRFDSVPRGLFARGFLRAYAREVELNPEQIVEQYRAEFERRPLCDPDERRSPTETPIDSLALSERMRGLGQTIGLVLVTLLGLLYFGFWQDQAPQSMGPGSKPTAAAPLPVPTTGSLDSTRDPSQNAPLKLELQTTGECWVAASVDGEQVIGRLMNAGERQQFDVHQQLTMRVGDPSALTFTINGATARQLGSAGKAVTVDINTQNYRAFLQTS